MNLADRIVALGVGKKCNKSYSIRSNQLPDDPVPVWTLRTSAGFVRDWRVAGALMEKCREKGFEICLEPGGCTIFRVPQEENIIARGCSDNAAHAIIQATVEALEA